MHLVGCIIRLYHDARSPERQSFFSACKAITCPIPVRISKRKTQLTGFCAEITEMSFNNPFSILMLSFTSTHIVMTGYDTKVKV